jgi:hypothetical protein
VALRFATGEAVDEVVVLGEGDGAGVGAGQLGGALGDERHHGVDAERRRGDRVLELEDGRQAIVAGGGGGGGGSHGLARLIGTCLVRLDACCTIAQEPLRTGVFWGISPRRNPP